MARKSRKVSDKAIARIYRKTRNLSTTAKAVGFTPTGVRNAVIRLGLTK